ncbi:PQQ-dependent sugar dehydrogenase [Psychrobacter arenosus]|nr:PQQ-dependent sugar dehydrogenase [Psychrobacter arenosus]
MKHEAKGESRRVNMPNRSRNGAALTGSVIVLGLLLGCSNSAESKEEGREISATAAPINKTNESKSDANTVNQAKETRPNFTAKANATFAEPWAMTALPKAAEGSIKLLVTQKTGELFIVDAITGKKTPITGVPEVAYGGQGGLGDIILAPDFAMSQAVYLSYVEAGTNTNASQDKGKFGAKVVKATLKGLDTESPSLQGITPIWQQFPKMSGQGHFSHRLLFSPDGRYLYISSGERQEKDPAQDMAMNLGKIVRLNTDGSIPKDNPFAQSDSNPVTQQIWSLGHRNVLGMRFDDNGNLWAHEMGPRGGDELNLIVKGQNYGWPEVSNGRNYSGIPIPDHDTGPEFAPPKISWSPVISPSALSIYQAGEHADFPAWQGKALISGLSSKALVIADLDTANKGQTAQELYRYEMGERIRSVLTIDGQVFLLEDGPNARLLQLLPTT